MILTKLNQNQEDAADVLVTYCCPSCDHILEVKKLLEGCPFCYTRFFMSNLFPKIPNYYFLPDYGMSKKEGNKRIKKWMFGGVISLNSCKVERDYCYVDLNVYMTNVYCQNKELVEKREQFRMKLCRNIRPSMDYGFSIKKLAVKIVE